MATTFTKPGDWHGTFNGTSETTEKVAGRPAPAAGFLYRRDINRVDRRWFGQGLTGWAPTQGAEVLGNAITVQNGPDILTGSALDTYLTMVDEVNESPPGTGLWEQVQNFVNYSDWVEWKIPT